jgi:RiboL-PSP-HEPN
MPKSARFRVLTKELNRLRKLFLPRIFSKTGPYSTRQIELTYAYRVFAHAEIEAYFEDRVWETAIIAKQNWDDTGKASRVLICLLAFSDQKMDAPPDTLSPRQGNRTVPPEKINVNEKIKIAINGFRKIIDGNHGIKEANLLKLLLPIGIDADNLDRVWLVTMNTFGEERGLIAHSSATNPRMQTSPDPQSELNRVQEILMELEKIDRQITDLL